MADVKLKKIMVVCMFGTPFPWIDDFVNQVQHLEKDGWYWKIFTPNKLESKGNVEFIYLNNHGFNTLCEQKLGMNPNLQIVGAGVPSVHITDFYIASGLIFEDYLKDADYWGIANLDIVFGNLSKFIPDEELTKYDLWTDEPSSFNGTFSLFKNTPEMNNLFKEIPEWQKKFDGSLYCTKCMGGGGVHQLWGTDEYYLTDVLNNWPGERKKRCGRPTYHPIHSHDRLEQHVPDVKLQIKEDGSLWELFKDINGPVWIHARPFIGREIAYFHFPKTKRWPKT